MANVVYVLGAGINKCIKDRNGLNPPLSTDFFQGALKHPRTGNSTYKETLKPVFDYIARYWKLSPQDLESAAFDLESCFTLIELQKNDAQMKKDDGLFVNLNEIGFRLTAMMAEYLGQFEHCVFGADSFLAFGEVILKERPAVLTFNYDTMLEFAVEHASRVNPHLPLSLFRDLGKQEVPDEELPYSHMNWNRPLGYGVRFDEVELARAGVSAFVPGERFYAHPSNQLYSPPILKMHGSINWFIYTGIKSHQRVDDAVVEERKGKTLHYESTWWFNKQPDANGVVIEPVIITPIINKRIDQFPMIPTIWQRAKEELSNCRRLVVGGYSFPPTDFHIRRLFLEAFSEHTPEEIVVINPDSRISQLVKDFCHFKRPVLVCGDLDEFMTLYRAG